MVRKITTDKADRPLPTPAVQDFGVDVTVEDCVVCLMVLTCWLLMSLMIMNGSWMIKAWSVAVRCLVSGSTAINLQYCIVITVNMYCNITANYKAM
jgi:hypothetical protein